VKVESVAADGFGLSTKEHHYVANVLRQAPGAELELFDGSGNVVRARLEDAGQVTVLERYSGQAVSSSVIAVATPKGDRADWIVEKCVELGAGKILWLICERSVVVPREDGKRLERFARIAEAAARQCGRNDVPAIDPPVKFADAVRALGAGCIAHMDGEPLPRAIARGTMPNVLIGPEGGFTDNELTIAENAGFVRVSLASHILRTETAAVAAAAILASSGSRE
jgi:16S rRNA (uracil1498-N3)-methyltransferase